MADLQNTAFSAFLIFSERILYPSYAAVPRLWNISGLGSFFAQAGLRGANSAFHAGKHTKSEERKKARQRMGARTPIEDKRDYETRTNIFRVDILCNRFSRLFYAVNDAGRGSGYWRSRWCRGGRPYWRGGRPCGSWRGDWRFARPGRGRFDWRSTSGAGNEARRAAPENGSAAEGDRSSAKRNRKTQRRRVLVQRAGEMISLLLIGHGEVNQGIWQKIP